MFASMLDDNKLLTLPNGERLNLPSNVRIMFEAEHLRYATLATVSRCGMIWFSEDIVEPFMVYRQYPDTLGSVPLDAEDDDALDIPERQRTMRTLAPPVQISSLRSKWPASLSDTSLMASLSVLR